MDRLRKLYTKAINTIINPSQNLSSYVYVALAIGITIGLGYLGSRIVTRVIAEVSCPLPASPSIINSSITITPDNVDGVVNCSGLDLIVGPTGEVTFSRYVTDDNDLNGDWGVTLTVDNLEVQPGGKITASGEGYLPGDAESPGGDGGNGAGASGGSGGGYGGGGGEGIPDGVNPAPTPGVTYGNQESPDLLGSPGGTSGASGFGGAGGGAIKIEASGTVTVNGNIEANGLDGIAGAQSSGGGGSGGSIWITADNFAGNGSVSANGGGASDATYQGGGGGGGRVVMLCETTNGFTGTATADGGATSNSQNGGDGSMIGPTCRPQAPTILKQFKTNNTTEIPVDGITTENSIIFAANMIDVDASETLALQIELLPIGTPFTGVPTHTQPSNFPNPQSCNTPPSDCGRVSATGLTRSTEYHWQARVRDSVGGISDWVSFGGNNESQRDVLVTGNPTTITQISGSGQTATVYTELTNPMVVKVTDTNGFPVPGYSVTWQVTSGANGGHFASPTSTTDINGEATNTYTVGKSAGTNNNQFQALGAGLSGSPVIFNASGIPDEIDRFTVDASSVAIINTNFDPVTITAYDQYNNIKTDYTNSPSLLAIDPNDPGTVMGGTLTPSSITFTGPDAGRITATNIQYDTEESIKLKVVDGSAEGLSNAIAVVTSLGSCPDADGIIDTNQTWVSDTNNVGIFDCRGLDIDINSGAVLTLDNYISGSTFYGATILADNFTVQEGSAVRSNLQGYGNNSGPGAGAQGNPAGGGGHGGYGGQTPRGGSAYDDLTQPTQLGSGGGRGLGSYSYANGGTGGGAIKLEITNTLLLDGNIEAYGGNGSVSPHGGQSGGGSGGSIWLIADTLSKGSTSSPTLSAYGGNGGNSGGGGAGGRIAVYASTSDTLTQDLTVRAYGGTGSVGGPGTYYYEGPTQAPGQGILQANNYGRDGRRAVITGTNQEYTFESIELLRDGDIELTDAGSTINLTSPAGLTGDGTAQLSTFGTVNAPSLTSVSNAGVYIEQTGTLITSNNVVVTNGRMTLRGIWQNIDNLTLGADADMVLYPDATMAVDGTFTFGDLAVSGTSIVYMLGDTGENQGITLNLENFSLDDGGSITADGRGYGEHGGPGAGSSGSQGGGGGYGGYGGQTSTGGSPYGDLTQPIDLGSGGGRGTANYSYATGARGGGAIKISVNDTARIDGTISANGYDGSRSPHGGQSGGGSGGSIWIEADVLTKTSGTSPTIRANGGHGGNDYGGGGSGGRIAIYAHSNDDFTTDAGTRVQSIGGTRSIGGPGTYYYEGPSQTSGQGILTVDNYSRNGRRAAISGTNQIYTFENIHLQRDGDLELTDPGSTVNITSTAGLTGDGTAQLSTYGQINAPSLDTISDAGVFIEPSGELITSPDVTIINSLITIRGTWQNIGDVTLSTNGDLTLYANSTMAPTGEYTFDDLTVGSSSVVTLYSDRTNNRGIQLHTTNFTLDQGGVVTSNSQGYTEGGGQGGGSADGQGGGGAYGGYGGVSATGGHPFGDLTQPLSLGSGGGRGTASYSYATGANGGGAIKITATSTATIDGTITVNGSNGSTSPHGGQSGGGSGGSIWIVANAVTKTPGTSPVVRANGGNGGSANGGGGSGGRIAIYSATSDDFMSDSNTSIQAYGGTGSIGGPGTVYYEGPTQASGQGLLTVDNIGRDGRRAAISGTNQTYTFENINLTRYGDLELTDPGSTVNITSAAGLTGDGTSQLYTYGLISGPSVNTISDAGVFIEDGGILLTDSDVTVTNALVSVQGSWLNIDNLTLASDGDLTLYPTAASATNGVFTFGDFLVSGSSVVTLHGNTSINRGVTLELDNFSLASGGRITADRLGYSKNSGTGAGGTNINPGGGGSFGGYGGGTTVGPYGDLTQPIELGSGGGNCYNYGGGGNGGGSIGIRVSGTATIDGLLTTNGGNGDSVSFGCQGGAGSGGSILITANTLTKTPGSTPVIRANGGVGYQHNGGSGSGGRIAIYALNSDNFTLDADTTISAYGGGGQSTEGGAGTFYYEGPGQTSGEGILFVDNNGTSGGRASITGAATTFNFERIELTRNGHLELTSSDSTVNLLSSSALTGDGSAVLATYGTINAPTLSEIIDAGIVIEQGGVLITDSDVRVENGTYTIRGTWQGLANLQLDTNADLTLYPTATGATDGKFIFGDLSVGSTSQITLLSDGSNNRGAILDVANFSLDAGGVVTADRRGYGENSGNGAGASGDPAGGGSYGGYAGGSTSGPYGDFRQPGDLGSGGGKADVCLTHANGGNGGGSIRIIAADTVRIDGTLTANGGNGDISSHWCKSGGGSGGSIWITADTLTKSPSSTPLLRVNGGTGGPQTGGSGSGGRIALYATTLDDFTTDINTRLQAYGGSGETVDGGPGTIYIENENHTAGEGTLIIDDNNNTQTNYAESFEPIDYYLHDLTIGNYVKVRLLSDTANNRGPELHLNGGFSLGTGALLDGIGRGFPAQEGPGVGEDGTGNSGGAGGAYGGDGGNGEPDAAVTPLGGQSYGSQRQPYSLGSGGGNSGPGASGGAGGGAVAILGQDGHIQIDGTINVSGTDGLIASPGGGGGAGGSILIEASTCDIPGDLLAEGGDGGDEAFDGGGGGGGRISILYTTGPCGITGTGSVAAGTSSGGQDGQVGTFPSAISLPSVPSTRDQYKSDSVTAIPVGGVTQEQQVVLKVSLYDPDASPGTPKTLRAEVEVVEEGDSFNSPVLGTGVTAGPSVVFTGGSPEVTEVPVTGLSPGVAYKWQARAVNTVEGVASSWSEFGGNPTSDPDFVVSTTTSLDIEVSSTTAVVGELLTLTVTALDGSSTQDPTYNGTVTFSSTSGTATLPANYIFGVADAGQHEFLNQLSFTEEGTYTVTVTDTLNGTLTDTTAVITVTDPNADSPPPSSDICVTNPNLFICQTDVEISNVEYTPGADSIEVCWDTNIPTVGFINYGKLNDEGEGVYTNTTDPTPEYATSSCLTLTDLAEESAYAIEITATSNAGKFDTHEGASATLGGIVPDEISVVECITIEENAYAFNSDHQAIVTYRTGGESDSCTLFYGNLGESLSYESPSSQSGINHSGTIELVNLNGTSDANYRIGCGVEINDQDRQCTVNGIIPLDDYLPYYPTIQERALTAVSELIVPGLLTLATILTTGLNLFTFPRFLLYGLFWIKDPNRNKGNPWGLVYDARTKDPVAFATVRLFQGDQQIAQKVTDLGGRFGIPVAEGKYKVEVTHSEYQAINDEVMIKPSEKYFSKDFALDKQQAQTQTTIVRQRLRENLSRINMVIVSVGFAFSVIAALISPITYNLAVLALYSFQFGLVWFLRIRNQRNWGLVINTKNRIPIGGAIVRLFSDDKDKTQQNVQITNDTGQYGFITKEGNYEVWGTASGYTGSDKKRNATIEKVKVKRGENIDITIKLEKQRGTRTKSGGTRSETGNLKSSPFGK